MRYHKRYKDHRTLILLFGIVIYFILFITLLHCKNQRCLATSSFLGPICKKKKKKMLGTPSVIARHCALIFNDLSQTEAWANAVKTQNLQICVNAFVTSPAPGKLEVNSSG